jgi:hypothetical protein
MKAYNQIDRVDNDPQLMLSGKRVETQCRSHR